MQKKYQVILVKFIAVLAVIMIANCSRINQGPEPQSDAVSEKPGEYTPIKSKATYASRSIKEGFTLNAFQESGSLARHPGLSAKMSLAAPAPVKHVTESYRYIEEGGFKTVDDQPLSTFSIDVDTASYSNVRRFLLDGRIPPADAVRIEEMVNYFSYDYTPPKEHDKPFSVDYEIAACPWNEAHQLLRVGLKGKPVAADERPESNIVFLLDVSGSMSSADKLPLLKKAMKMLVNNLTEKDRVAIVVYAGASGMVLPSTTCGTKGKPEIFDVLSRLESGGSTHGSQGIELAYKIAQKNFIPNGINRVILATDGDFNVGVTSEGELVRLIKSKAESGVFLTVLGFGTGNLNDATMESLADKGNGNYGYIDNLLEARKVLVQEIGGTLVTIAKDVKIQIEFNPKKVAAYRLIGYENRTLNNEDFNDDKKDAGEIGAGHTVTALYEIVPAGSQSHGPKVDTLKYQTRVPSDPSVLDELMTIKLRYKKPDGHTSQMIGMAVKDDLKSKGAPSTDMQFAAAVACFGMVLKDSEHSNGFAYDDIVKLALSGKGYDRSGRRAEFITLVDIAKELDGVL